MTAMTTTRRSAAVMLAGAAGAVLVATPAAAHVTIYPHIVDEESVPRVEFRVPNERATAATTGLTVQFPQETPVPMVWLAPVPGWSAEVTYAELEAPVTGPHGEEITEVVDSVTWTADDPAHAIGPGEFGEFPVSMGPVPAVDELFFPAVQEYADGEVVRWIEQPTEDVADPSHPAPALHPVAGDGGGHGGHGEDETEEAHAAGGDGTAGVWFGAAGLLAGLVAFVLAGLAYLRTRAES